VAFPSGCTGTGQCFLLLGHGPFIGELADELKMG